MFGLEGNVRSKRQQESSCNNCREEERKDIFQNYWQLGDEWTMRFHCPACRYDRKGKNSIKETKMILRMKQKQQKKEKRHLLSNICCIMRVRNLWCVKFFFNTLGVSAQVVKPVFKKMGTTGVVAADRRSRVCKNSKLDDSIKQSVRDYINLFETVESIHNISKMYVCMYVFSFFISRKDMCYICNKYNECSMVAKNQMEVSFFCVPYLEKKFLILLLFYYACFIK